MRQRSYLAGVASPIGAGEALAFPLYRPAPEEARVPAAETRAAVSSPAESPPRTVRRKLATAIPASESLSLPRAAEPPLAPGPMATNPAAPIPASPETATPDPPAPSAAPVAPASPSRRPLERAVEPLAMRRPEVTPLATRPLGPMPVPTATLASFPETPAPAEFAAGDAPPAIDPGPGSLRAVDAPRRAAAVPNSPPHADRLGDPIIAPPPRPRDPGAPNPSDPFSPPARASSAPETRERFPRVEIGIVEVRGAPAPQPPAPALVAVAAPPSGPVARGYGWRYGLYQG